VVNDKPIACIFCGSSEGTQPEIREAALEVTTALVEAGYDLLYGGARVGIMGAVADRGLELGANVYGVIPGFLSKKEIIHLGLTRIYPVPSMHQRKVKMIELSEVFVALPGGFGTMDELFEVLTLAQLGAHRKPTAILNVRDYFTPLEEWIEGAVKSGFVAPEHCQLFLVEKDPQLLVERLGELKMPRMKRWIQEGEA
jgi:uncharacterized protein (TIGR00730 family)